MNINIALKIFLKRIFLIALAVAGYLAFIRFWLGKRHNRLVIIRYHSISDYRNHEVNVRVDVFRKQMKFLAGYYKPISLKQALGYLRNKKNIPERTVVVTFDDGYKDNFSSAYEILKKFNISATIFLTAGYIGTDNILPHDISDNPLHNRLLSWDEVRDMARGGIEFGSHTLTHANLGNNRVDSYDEIQESKKIIEKELNQETWVISYPFGLLKDCNKAVKNLARKAGYTCGCSAMNGANDKKTDVFELRRIGIEASDNMFTFRAKLNGALDLLILKDKPPFNKLLNVFNRLIGVCHH